jgi:PTS system mannose-specific IID component
MQNIGLVFALEPGLRVIYGSPLARQKARKRYLRHYNTHMFWTPLLVGVFLSLEDKIARGLFPPNVLESVKNTTVYTLSAIGDSVFHGSLLVFWSLCMIAMLVSGQHGLAVAWVLIWFFALQLFKFWTFLLGYKEGLKFLVRLKKWDLINWGRRLKYMNALLLAWVLYLVRPGDLTGVNWACAVAALAMGAWLVARGRAPRELAALAIVAAYLCLPFLAAIKQRLSGG